MRHWRPSEKEKRHRCESFVAVRLAVMGVPLKKKQNNEVKMQRKENSVENGPQLSNTMIARGLTPVKDNLLVIRMDVAGLTQWGSSWTSERVYGRVGFGGIVEICGKVKGRRSATFHLARKMGTDSCSILNPERPLPTGRK